jgi:hypothetical protein
MNAPTQLAPTLVEALSAKVNQHTVQQEKPHISPCKLMFLFHATIILFGLAHHGLMANICYNTDKQFEFETVNVPHIPEFASLFPSRGYIEVP